MKIVQLVKRSSTKGGVRTYLLRLFPALERAGHVTFMVHADSAVTEPLPGVARHLFVDRLEHFDEPAVIDASTAQVIEFLEDVRPDVVHIHGNFALEAAIRERFPALKSLHVYDFCPTETKYHHALGKPCHHPTGLLCVPRMVYKRCERSWRPSVIWGNYRRSVAANAGNANYRKLVVASAYVKRQALATGYQDAQVEVVPYFTTLPPSVQVPARQSDVILFVGRVMREKGLFHLVSALPRLRATWRLRVAGEGMDSGRVRQLADRLRISDRVEFVGWASGDELMRLYQEAAVVAVPSIWPEPFGIVGIEAMVCGAPVVAFDVGGMSEWLQDHVTGYLVKPNDVNDMAARLDQILQDPDTARAMGARGHERVQREFTEARHISRLTEIYRDVQRLWRGVSVARTRATGSASCVAERGALLP